MRDFISGLLLIVLVSIFLLNGGSKAEGFDPSSKTISLELVPINGHKMVELRQIAVQNNWQLEFVAESKTILINYADGRARLSVAAGSLDGEPLENPPQIIDGRTYLELATVKLLSNRLSGEQAQLLTGIYSQQKEVPAGDKISVEILLVNISDDPLSLSFNSGQRYDLFLQKDGQEIWRWSAGRFFTMALVTKDLAPGAELAYQLEIPTDGLTAGSYILGGELTTIGNPLPLVDLEIKLSKN